MPDTPTKKEKTEISLDESENDSWGEDQKKHGYYYDDAHGYEVYTPEKETDGEARREESEIAPNKKAGPQNGIRQSK